MGSTQFNEIPEKFYYLDDTGEFSKTIKTDQKLELSQYWANKHQQVGLIMLLSGLILVGILLNETNMVNTMWNGFLNLIASLIGGIF